MTEIAGFRIGAEVSGYRVDELIGRGGMGEVYRAWDERLERNVALKILIPRLADDDAFRERLLRESRLAASLDHPNVVPVYDAGEADGRFFLAMRYVEGTDLRAVLRGEGALSPERAIDIAAQVAGALDAAHERGLVHRDVKPSNVLLDERGHCYLADFGLTQSVSSQGQAPDESLLGTLDYVAPEQIRGGDVDGRADVYSLGCLLFECLTGEVPFARPSEVATLYAHLEDEPPRPSERRPELPVDLDGVLGRAMAKDADDRQPSCTALVEAARSALGIAAPTRPLWSRAPVVLGLAGLVILVTALSAFLLSHGDDGSAKPSTKPTLTPTVASLQRIDPETNRLVATIKASSDPSGVAVGEGAVWVTNRYDGTLSRIDPTTDAVSKTSAAGADPTHVAVGLGAVWVSNGNDETMARLDPDTLKIVRTYSPGRGACGRVTVGAGAVWLVAGVTLVRVGPDDKLLTEVTGIPSCVTDVAVGGGAVWITAYLSKSVTRVDPRELKAVATIPLAFVPAGIAADREGVWVVDSAGDSIVKISPMTNRVVGRVRVGDVPDTVAAGEGSIWVANLDEGTVSRIDPRQARVVATITVGGRPTEIAAGEGGVWVIVHPR